MERLFLELCRREPDPERAGCRTPLPSTAGEELSALAARHALQGLVFSRLLAWGAASPLAAEAERWAETVAVVRRRATFWDMEQDRVLGALAREGHHPLVLKGGALRRGWFNPVERAMGDLDILVRPDEVRGILTALERAGYRSEYPDKARAQFLDHHHHERVAHSQGFLVEVHWRLTRPVDLIQLDSDAFHDRAVTVETDGAPPLRIPSAEDLLIHTVSQSEQDAVRGLRRIVDLDRIVARDADLDWGYVEAAAERAGLRGALCVTLRLARLLLGTPIPPALGSGQGLSPATRRNLAGLDPVRRLLDEPGTGEAVEFQLFRLWCARPDHRDVWIRRRLSGRGDPLHWVWAGKDDPDDADPEGTTGVSFVLKLAALQTILSLRTLGRALRGRDLDPFWR